MTKSGGAERRRFSRFETDAKVEFRVTFDIRTKVDFQIKDKTEHVSPKYSAVSKNVSAEGLAFQSEKDLGSGDKLALEVYVPSSKKPVQMDGEVRWCIPADANDRIFETGIKILTVEGQSVDATIFIDPTHKIAWSIVLESVFGSFKNLMRKSK